MIYILTIILISTLICVILIGKYNYLKFQKLNKDELKNETDKYLDKSSTALFIKNILELFLLILN